MILNNTLKVLACILLVVLIIGGGNAFWNLRLFLQQGQGAAQNLKNSSARADTYLDKQLDVFESDTYQKYLKGNFAVGSLVQSVVEGINTKTLPKLNKNLDSSDAFINSLNRNTASLDRLVANLDNRVSGDGGLLPTTTAAIDSIRTLTDTELRAAIAEFTLAGKNVRIITESPELQNLPKEIAQLAQSANKSAGSVEVILNQTEATAGNLAGITGNLNKISDDSAKKVHSLLNPPPAPWYKKYILTPLREIGGVTYLLVRIANGL